MEHVETRVFRHRMLCDGTPRREKGYRAIVETLGPEPHPNRALATQGWKLKRFHQSPLFAAEADAAAWVPDGLVDMHPPLVR